LIDLNHGSGVKLGARTIGDDINDAIDAGIIARRAKEPPRDYLGASVLGDPCGRRLCYIYAKTPADVDFTPLAIRRFDIGHEMEDFLGGEAETDGVFKAAAARWFQDAGFVLKTRTKTGDQFRWKALDGKISGAIDGVFMGRDRHPVIIPIPCIWETKALAVKGWNKIKKHGLKIAHDIYYGQVQINMAYLDVFRTLFTAINKNTQELHHELIEFDPPRAQRISDRAVDVIKAVESGTLLDRVANNPDFFLCKMCSYQKRCWP